MKINKSLAIVGAASTIGLATVLGIGVASAATITNNTGNDSLVNKIASTFHLNKTDVQKVFDQNRTEHEAAQTTKVDTELTQLVTDGKITAAQKTAILAKRAELQQQREANKDSMQSKTESDRKAEHDAERTALEKWATDNGLSTTYLHYVVGGPGHHGHEGPNGDMPPAGAASQSSTGASSVN